MLLVPRSDDCSSAATLAFAPTVLPIALTATAQQTKQTPLSFRIRRQQLLFPEQDSLEALVLLGAATILFHLLLSREVP